jgi:hypothetical protein
MLLEYHMNIFLNVMLGPFCVMVDMVCVSFIHSILSNDSFKASSKTVPPHSAI